MLLSLALFGFATQARATTVGCNGAPSGTYDFPTLTAAICGAPLSNNAITIYGTCTEDVVINGAQNLTISGAPGAVLMDANLTTSQVGGVLEIDNSQNVAIQNLKIQLASYAFYGPFPGIVVNGSSLLIQQIDIEGSTGTDGIDINPMSSVQLVGANLVENNNDGQGNSEGISLTGPAANLNVGQGPGAPAGCTVIQGNGDDGILVESQASVTVIAHPNRCVTIQNNGSFGVQVSGGSTGLLANRSSAPVITLSGNLGGAAATLYGQLRLNGPMLIQSNSMVGVWLRDASTVLNGSSASPNGPTIQQNGGDMNPPCCLSPGAISIAGNANLVMNTGTVINNEVPGISVEDDSSALIFGPSSITQNSVGVSVTNASSVHLGQAPSITGNANGDIVCGAFSVAHGDASAVGKILCDSLMPEHRGQGNGHYSKIW